MSFHLKTSKIVPAAIPEHLRRNSSFILNRRNTRPSRPGAEQTWIGRVASAGAFACRALSDRMSRQEMSFAAAHQTRSDIAQRDGMLSGSAAPRAGLRRVGFLRLNHLRPPLKELDEADGLRDTFPASKQVNA
jgi:hypothetical protein